ncbi:MAG TPA: LacI family DNA-binding transcriptional regulator [Mycobacteriales bacterium]
MTGIATIYDVAARAGVSISTVSLVLNVPGRVSPATAERVLSAMRDLDYVPKAEAVTRARRGVGRVGVLAPFSTYPSFARRLNGVFRALAGGPNEVVVFDQRSAAQTTLLSSLPLTRRLDGLLVMALPLDDELAAGLHRQRMPTVLVEVDRPDFPTVAIDDAAGGRMVAEHLLGRGHRRFAYVGEQQVSDAYVSQSQARLGGFRQGLSAAGVELADRDVRLVPHGAAAAGDAVRELLDRPDRPTAVFAHDDILAAGVWRAVRDAGLRVPAEVAVVGFDDGDLAEHLGLTTVHQPLEESGELAADLLVGQLRGTGGSTRHVRLALTLIVREST